jgi:hypothetical protein
MCEFLRQVSQSCMAVCIGQGGRAVLAAKRGVLYCGGSARQVSRFAVWVFASEVCGFLGGGVLGKRVVQGPGEG